MHRPAALLSAFLAISTIWTAAPTAAQQSSVANATMAPELVPALYVEHLDVLATESMVAEAPDGTLYVASYEGPSIGSDSESRKLQNDDSYWAKASANMRDRLWRSDDHGATWSWTVLSSHRFDDRPWVEVALRKAERERVESGPHSGGARRVAPARDARTADPDAPHATRARRTG